MPTFGNENLTIRDTKIAISIVNRCRDVGHDAHAWNQRLAEELQAEFGTQLTNTFLQHADSLGLDTSLVFVDVWQDPTPRELWLKLINREVYRDHGTFQEFFREFQGARTARRCELVPDEQWYVSQELKEHRAACGQDDMMISCQTVPNRNLLHCLTLNHASGGPKFSDRDQRLVRLIHETLTSMMGTTLTLDIKPSIGSLPPRLQEVLELLMKGQSEKEIATQLSLSRNTIHSYVTDIYRRFKVNSRSELLTTLYRQGWNGKP